MRVTTGLCVLGILLAVATGPAAAGSEPARQRTAPPSAAGAIAPQVAMLLDGVQAVIDKLGTSAETDLGHDLSVLANTGHDLAREQFITSAFRQRFARLLLVMRLEIITDTGKILAPIVDREFIAFVRDVTGKTYDPAGPPTQQIGMFSEAVATELTRLRALKR